MPVFPFDKFPGVDPILGPEMRSTGEVMGIGESFGEAFAKALLGANRDMPKRVRAFLSVKDADKQPLVEVANMLLKLNFELISTSGTARSLQKAGVACEIFIKYEKEGQILSIELKTMKLILSSIPRRENRPLLTPISSAKARCNIKYVTLRR